MRTGDITIKIGGIAGAGISATVNVLAKILKDHGYRIQTFRDIPSRIRGGHTNETVRASHLDCFSTPDYIDILIVFDRATILRCLREVRDKGVVIIDISSVKYTEDDFRARDDLIIYEIPAKTLALKGLGNEIYKNTVILGVLAELLDMDIEIVKNVISRTYQRKGEKIISTNIKALDIGIKYAKENIEKKDDYKVIKKEFREETILITGNEAIAMGAIAAGCRFMSGYPITPATQILEFMIRHLPKYGGVAVQTEDEIAAINYAIGAAIAGARAMTATSGPGFSLMTEAVSLAGMAEVPLVIVNSNRAGPSTGMATKTEQSDLLFTIFQGHGDFPKIVLAPSTNEEAFYMTAEAFNIAEKCQCPVIILVDEFISHGYQTAKKFDFSRIKIDRGELYIDGDIRDDMCRDGLFLRYKITDTGISPRTMPKKGNKPFLTATLEHDEHGWPTEDPIVRVSMMNKRLRKIKALMPELMNKFGPEIIGDDDSRIGIISYGSTKYVISEAMKKLIIEKNITTKYLRLRMLWPLPEKEIREFVNNADKIFIVEMNATAQLEKLIRIATGPSDKFVNILKYDGRMFSPSEVYKRIEEEL